MLAEVAKAKTKGSRRSCKFESSTNQKRSENENRGNSNNDFDNMLAQLRCRLKCHDNVNFDMIEADERQR